MKQAKCGGAQVLYGRLATAARRHCQGGAKGQSSPATTAASLCTEDYWQRQAQAATSRPGPLGCSRSSSPAGSPSGSDQPVTLMCIDPLQVADGPAGLQRRGGRLQELRVVTRQAATPGEQVMSPINLEDMEIFQHSDSGDAFGAWLQREKRPRNAGGGPGGGGGSGHLVYVTTQAALLGLGGIGGGAQLAEGLCCSP